MQAPSIEASRSDAKASRTCNACKERKRKCGRELPSCSFCQGKKHLCEYPQYAISRESKKSLASWPGISKPRNKDSNFTAVFFLDSKLFRQSQMEIPRATFPVPSAITDLIGDAEGVRTLATQYFDSIHIWLPFISKKRFYQILLRPLSQPRADVALLLLCMKLITWTSSEAMEDPHSPLYFAAKRFLLEIESTGILTLQAAQACVLLTLYELGHAIYPSAYISVGACTRYVMALGLNGKASSHANEVSVWINQEERRRVWWAVVILDRFANMGCAERPLSTPELRSDDMLPVDDLAWDQGVITYNDEFTVFSPANIRIGMFARFCQATNLLSQVLRHVSEGTANETFDIQEAVQIDRTIRSLITLTNYEGQLRATAVCLQTAVCYR
ncbi:hypothetical protein N431DRAFT_494935 [Stipitochalara longipes BDJ]|nr:hypothetical protein N431DRAFT_494935 [Stipitochalara longipes BDJ]